MRDLEKLLCDSLAEVLEIDGSAISANSTFYELGSDSLQGLRFVVLVQKVLSVNIDPEWFFDYPSIRLLSEFLRDHYSVELSGLGYE